MASRRFETATLPLLGKQGLFPGIEHRSGIRKFGENELEALRMIECLKMSGLEIKDIKQFMDWCVYIPFASGIAGKAEGDRRGGNCTHE